MTFSASELAARLSKELASRWNVGISKMRQRSGFRTSFCSAGFDPHSLEPVAPCPGPRSCEPIDLSLFDNAPPYTAPPLWTAEDILCFLPGGSPGLDGQTSDWIEGLHLDALRRLADLLNLADRGLSPSFWNFGRVTHSQRGGLSSGRA